jgi:hypothetical protein
VSDLRIPLAEHVLVAASVDYRKAYEENVSVGVRQRSKPVVFFLTSSIPQSCTTSI